MLTPGIERMSRGLQREFERVDLLSQNMANTHTPGFRSVLSGQRQGERLDQWISQAPAALEVTNRPLDLCPPEGSYFAVLKNDQVQFTRRGDFRIDDSGTLVVGSGEPALSTSGSPIVIDQNLPFEIDNAGTVRQNGKDLATLRRASLTRPNGTGGSAVFLAAPDAPISESSEKLRLGALDSSDVDTAQDTVRLSESLARARLFQGFAQVQDQTVEQAIRDLGSSR